MHDEQVSQMAICDTIWISLKICYPGPWIYHFFRFHKCLLSHKALLTLVVAKPYNKTLKTFSYFLPHSGHQKRFQAYLSLAWEALS